MWLLQSKDADCTYRSRAAAHTEQRATRPTIVWPGLAHTGSLKNNKIIKKKVKTTLLIKPYSMLQTGKAQHETTGKILFLFPASACQMNRQGCLFHTEELVCHPSSAEQAVSWSELCAHHE